MEARPSRTELIKILVQERNHHFSHPHDVAVKFLYSIGGTITTVLVAFFIKNSGDSNLKQFIGEHFYAISIFSLLIVVGYVLIFWGLSEHTVMHTDQRKRLELAIEYLVAVNPNEFDFDLFWNKFGKVKLKYSRNKEASTLTNLIVAEPDTRNWIHYHDRKIELGILIILIGVMGYLATLFI